jgi:hypothetical protein
VAVHYHSLHALAMIALSAAVDDKHSVWLQRAQGILCNGCLCVFWEFVPARVDRHSATGGGYPTWWRESISWMGLCIFGGSSEKSRPRCLIRNWHTR